jgi:hypothetical protein
VIDFDLSAVEGKRAVLEIVGQSIGDVRVVKIANHTPATNSTPGCFRGCPCSLLSLNSSGVAVPRKVRNNIIEPTASG